MGTSGVQRLDTVKLLVDNKIVYYSETYDSSHQYSVGINLTLKHQSVTYFNPYSNRIISIQLNKGKSKAKII